MSSSDCTFFFGEIDFVVSQSGDRWNIGSVWRRILKKVTLK